MSDLTRYEEDPLPAIAISKTELQPIDKEDQRSLWLKFVDAIRQTVGMKPLDLALRFGEAEARKREAEARRLEAEAQAKEADAHGKEVENEIKLLQARQQFDLTQAELRRQADEAELAKQNGQIQLRKSKAEARIQEAVARQAERLKLTPDEAFDEVRRIVEKIRDCGGDVEVPGMDFDITQPEDPRESTGEK